MTEQPLHALEPALTGFLDEFERLASRAGRLFEPAGRGVRRSKGVERHPVAILRQLDQPLTDPYGFWGIAVRGFWMRRQQPGQAEQR